MAGGRNCKLSVIYRPSTGVCCSCSLCMLDQKSGRGIATSICMDVCWGMGALRDLLLLQILFLRHLNGLLLLGLTHFVRINKKYIPKVKTSRNSCFRCMGGGKPSFPCSVALRSLSQMLTLILCSGRVQGF